MSNRSAKRGVVCVDTSTPEEPGVEWVEGIGKTAPFTGIAVDSERVVVTTAGTPERHGRVVSVQRTSGDVRWEQSFGNASLTPPVLASDHVAVSLYVHEDIYHQYLQDSGKVAPGSDPDETMKRTRLPKDVENIHILSIETGEIAMSGQVSETIKKMAVLRNDQLILMSESGVCLSLRTG